LLEIPSVTGPIYITIALGYLATRFSLFAPADMRVFGKFVLYFALPALLFRALSQKPFAEIIDAGYIAAYLAGTLSVLVIGYLATRKLAGQPVSTATFSAMGMSCPNSGFVGYPILLLTLPSIAGTALALNMFVENLVIIPLVLMLAERSKGAAGHPAAALAGAFRRLAVNPIVIGLAAGVAVSLLSLELPGAVTRTVDLVAASSAAVSLFVIGGTLVGLPLRGMNARIIPIVAGKLVLHPFLVAAAVISLPFLGIAEIGIPLKQAVIISAAMPIMGIYPILAQKYGEEGLAAVALLATTFVSFFTINALLWVLEIAPG
jgi:malonate transporter and related proteins